MKKIMFNDKYGLTQAVLEGRKTQTRRIVHESALIDWEIHDKYHNLPDAVGHRMDFEYFMSKYARYEVGEKVAVAQCYFDCGTKWAREHIDIASDLIKSKGYNNKLFVRTDIMPHRIRITNVRTERLQDISDEDCLKEGICKMYHSGGGFWCYTTKASEMLFHTPQEAYATLIDKVSGKGIWEKNPYVFVYDFELVK